MALYHVTITGRDRRHLTELGTKFRILVVGYREDPKHGAQVDAYVPAGKEKWLRSMGTASRVSRRSRAGTGSGRRRVARLCPTAARDRYGDIVWAGGYLTADEIERAIALGPERHGGYVERIALPHRTWEKRRIHALRIGKGRGRRRPGICFIGGVHGREWGSADILSTSRFDCSGPTATARASVSAGGSTRPPDPGDRGNQGHVPGAAGESRWPPLQHGTAADVAEEPPARATRPRGPHRIGVDLNRNFPMMWHYDRHFAPGTVESSHHPSDFETYVGPRAASEPETRNVIWLLDSIRRSAISSIFTHTARPSCYSWGTDENQSDDPTMCFSNADFDGKRGRIHDDDYREHIDRG